jgi:AMMECR1 domain-containing protein
MRIGIGVALMAMIVLPAPGAWGHGLSAFARPESERAIAKVTQEAIWAHVSARPYTPKHVPEALRRPAGVFVTLSRRGVTRGCWGTVTPRGLDAAHEVATNAVKALSLDYRQRPIQPSELPELVAHVSLIGELRPVSGPEEIQPRRFGLLVSGAGKGGVLLPGEAATARWAIETCRRKAGLRPKERASMYQFETVVVGPVPLKPPASQSPISTQSIRSPIASPLPGGGEG